MFIVTTTKDKTITWPVKVEIAADGGKIAKHEFTGVFKLLDDDDRDAQIAALKVGEPENADEPDSAWKERSVDGILMSMVGWKQVCDENKAPIEFNRDSLLAAARSVHGLSILRAINTAIGEIRAGARAKN
jgi:hypothetical protein